VTAGGGDGACEAVQEGVAAAEGDGRRRAVAPQRRTPAVGGEQVEQRVGEGDVEGGILAGGACVEVDVSQ
jgi:hypothetical protein